LKKDIEQPDMSALHYGGRLYLLATDVITWLDAVATQIDHEYAATLLSSLAGDLARRLAR
jgi:hypothetical protein